MTVRYVLPSDMSVWCSTVDDNGNFYILGIDNTGHLVVYKSTDEGVNWSKIVTGPSYQPGDGNTSSGGAAYPGKDRIIITNSVPTAYNIPPGYLIYDLYIYRFNMSSWSANPDAFESTLSITNIVSYFAWPFQSIGDACVKDNGDFVMLYGTAYIKTGSPNTYYMRTKYLKIVGGTLTSNIALDAGGTSLNHYIPRYCFSDADGNVYCSWEINGDSEWCILSNTFSKGTTQTKTGLITFDSVKCQRYTESSTKKFMWAWSDDSFNIKATTWTSTSVDEEVVLHPYGTYGNYCGGNLFVYDPDNSKFWYCYAPNLINGNTVYRVINKPLGGSWDTNYWLSSIYFNIEDPDGSYIYVSLVSCFYYNHQIWFINDVFWEVYPSPDLSSHFFFYSFDFNTLCKPIPTTISLKTITPTIIFVNLEAYPVSDSSLGNWSNELGEITNIYLSINENNLDNSDYIRSQIFPVDNIYRCKITSLSTPGSMDGIFIRYTYWRDNSDFIASCPTYNLKVRLLENTTTIHEWTHTSVGDIVVLAENLLSLTDATTISNWSDLYLEFEAYTS